MRNLEKVFVVVSAGLFVVCLANSPSLSVPDDTLKASRSLIERDIGDVGDVLITSSTPMHRFAHPQRTRRVFADEEMFFSSRASSKSKTFLIRASSTKGLNDDVCL
jgi:hypothetical protein